MRDARVGTYMGEHKRHAQGKRRLHMDLYTTTLRIHVGLYSYIMYTINAGVGGTGVIYLHKNNTSGGFLEPSWENQGGGWWYREEVG